MSRGDSIVSAIVAALVVGLFVHVAARIVLDRSTWLRGIAAGVLGILLGSLAAALIGQPLLSALAGLAVFALVTAAIYRTNFWKGVAVGAMAWVLSLLVSLALGAILGALRQP
ncbi:MAG: hypothetical protein AABX89_04960 [Candidatus Thermoplasmatota archaeon]